MSLREPHVQRHQARLGAKAEKSQQEGGRGPLRREMRTAHRRKGELPAAALHDTEAQKNRDRPHVRDQQIQKARAADFGDAVLGGHEEVGRQGHGFPRHHERVRVVRQEYEPHARQKQVVLQAHQARRGTAAAAEVSGRKEGDAGRGDAEQKEKEARERITAHMEGQVGKPDWQHGLFRRRGEARRGDHGEGHATEGAERKERPPHKTQARRAQQTRQADETPEGDERQAGAQR